MGVTARFKVGRVTLYNPTDPEEFAKIVNDPESKVGDASAEIEMVPDYGQGRNSEWAYASPQGVFRLTVANPAALRQMTHPNGSEVHITMEFSQTT